MWKNDQFLIEIKTNNYQFLCDVRLKITGKIYNNFCPEFFKNF